MPERFSPAQPNYLRFVFTPTIDIEPFFSHQPLLLYSFHLLLFCLATGVRRSRVAIEEDGKRPRAAMGGDDRPDIAELDRLCLELWESSQ